MEPLRSTKLWIASQPAVYRPTGAVQDAYRSILTGVDWSSLKDHASGFKIFSGTIYEFSKYGYTSDASNPYYYYPAAATEVLELLRDISRLNSYQNGSLGSAMPVKAYMESPVLMPGVLPNGAEYNHHIEGFDGSFLGVMGYLRNSMEYAVRSKKISYSEMKNIAIKYIAMDEPLFFASVYKTPDNLVIDGTRIQSPEWSIDEVAKRAVNALVQAKAVLGPYDPGLRFGDIEPLPYVTPLQVDTWVKAFERAGLAAGLKGDNAKLAFFQADVVWGVPGWEQNLLGVSQVLAANKIPLDIIINGNGNESDGVVWADNALNNLIRITALDGLNYQSLSVQNWNFRASTPLIGNSPSLAQSGTIANTARFIPSLNEVELAFERVAPAHAPNHYELFTLTRMLATDEMTAGSLNSAVAMNAPLRNGLLSAAQTGATVPLNIAGQSGTRFENPTQLRMMAQVYAPAGMQITTNSVTVFPGISNAEFNLDNVWKPNEMGLLYFVQAPGQTVVLPDGAVAVISALNFANNNDRMTIYGGSTKGYTYLAVGAVAYNLGSATEVVVDATGTGRSIVYANVLTSGATIRGVAATIGQMRITGSGKVVLSAQNENLRVYAPAGMSVDLQGGKNVEIIIDSTQSSPARGGLQVHATAMSAPLDQPTIAIRNKTQSVNNRTSTPISVQIAAIAASNKFDGGTGGIVMSPTEGGTIYESSGNKNVLWSIKYKTSITLSATSGSFAQFLKGSSGSVVTITSSRPVISVASGESVRLTVSTSLLGAGTALEGGGSSTLVLKGGGNLEIGGAVRGFSLISIGSDSVNIPLVLRITQPAMNTVLSVNYRLSTIYLDAPVSQISNSSTHSVTIFASAPIAGTRFDFGGGSGVLKVTTSGVFSSQISGKARVEVFQPSTVYLNSNKSLHVVVPAENIGMNAIGIAAPGQKVTILNSRYSVIYAAANNVGVGSGTEISAGGFGQLNIYRGGSVTLGIETSGIKEIFLYKDIGSQWHSLQMSDFQAKSKIIDIEGGARIRITEKTQEVENRGAEKTIVYANGLDAGLKINGGTAGAILYIGQNQDVVLSDQLYNVLVNGGFGTKISSGVSGKLSLDLSAGGSEAHIGGVGQVVRTGMGNTIFDHSGGGIVLEGTFDDWDMNRVSDVGRNDMIRILDVRPDALSVRADDVGGAMKVELQTGIRGSSIVFDGRLDWSHYEIASDGLSGSLLYFR